MIHINKYLPTAGVIAGVVIAGALITSQALLNYRVSSLEKYPVKVQVTKEVLVTATPSATVKPAFFKYVTPTISKTK